MTVQMTMEEYKKLESASEQLEQIKEKVKSINNAEGMRKTEETYKLIRTLGCISNPCGYI